MSKRKNRSTSPNLPEAALERARQLAQEQNGEQEKPKNSEEPAQKPAPSRASARRTERAAERARSRRPGLEPIRAKGGRGDRLDFETIKYKLAHPTRAVTEEQFRQDYTYVIRDLRSMGLLAAGLFLLLIMMAQFL